MAAVVEPIKQATSASPGLVVETSPQPGHVLDRIGLVDGVMLYPVGTLLRERSLPPAACTTTACGRQSRYGRVSSTRGSASPAVVSCSGSSCRTSPSVTSFSTVLCY